MMSSPTINDELTNNYDTYTTVTTGLSTVPVQAFLQAGSAKSLTQPGQSNQTQHIQLHLHSNGGGVVTVTAANQTIPYGSPLPPVTYTYSGFTNGDTSSVLAGLPSCSYTIRPGSPVGTYQGAAVCTQGTLSSPAYTFRFVPGSVTITPAPLTITSSNATITYGAVPPVHITYQGFVNGDTPANLAVPPSCVPSGSDVGTWPITCGGAVDSNYAIAYSNGTLTVRPAPATITFPPPSAMTVTASPSGATGTVPVTITISANAGSITTALPITYTLTGNGVTQTCVDRSGAGSNGNSLQSTCSFSALTPGGYTVTVQTGGNYTAQAHAALKVVASNG